MKLAHLVHSAKICALQKGHFVRRCRHLVLDQRLFRSKLLKLLSTLVGMSVADTLNNEWESEHQQMARDLTISAANLGDRVQNPLSPFDVFAQHNFRTLSYAYRYPHVRNIVDPTLCIPYAVIAG